MLARQSALRRTWLGIHPDDVATALADADARRQALETQLAQRQQEATEYQREIRRLETEMGRLYNQESGVARAIILAQEAARRVQQEAEIQAAHRIAAAEDEADRIVAAARVTAHDITYEARTDAGRDREQAARMVEQARAQLLQTQANIRATVAAGREVAQNLIDRLDAAAVLVDRPEEPVEPVEPSGPAAGSNRASADTSRARCTQR